MLRYTTRILTWLVLFVLVVSLFTPAVTQNPTEFPPQVVRKSLTWQEGGELWILDVALSSSMPWIISGLGNISVVATLRVTTSNSNLYLVLRVFLPGGAEYASKFVGTLSKTSPEVRDSLQVVVSPLYFRGSEALFRTNLTVVLEGYVGTKKFNATMGFPVLISAGRAKLDIELKINGRLDYNYIRESIARVNVSAMLRNPWDSYIDGLTLELYINNTLIEVRTVGKLGPLESKEIRFSLLNYFRAGIYYLMVRALYYLSEGVAEATTAIGILEVYKDIKISLSVDRPVVVEGTQITFSGTLTPRSGGVLVIIEKLVGSVWVTLGTVTADPQGSFKYTWRAENVPPNSDYVEHSFRARVPLSLIGGDAGVYSNSVTVRVFSSKNIADFIADISLDVSPATVVKGHNTSIIVKLRPEIPVCIPVKIVYKDPATYEWVELSEVTVCDGRGYSNLVVRLPPGSYPLKALVTSGFTKVESLSKVLTVIDIPRISIEVKKSVLYKEPLKIIVKLEPVPKELVSGQVKLLANATQLSSSNFTMIEGRTEIDLGKATLVGTLNITACALVYQLNICNSTTIQVVRPSISISPASARAEVGTAIDYSISITPAQIYPLKVSVMLNGVPISTYSAETNELGLAKVTVGPLSKAGRYSVLVEVVGTEISAVATLDVIEIVRSIYLQILNESVPPSSKVVARVSLYPSPSTPTQVAVLVRENGTWSLVAYELITNESKLVSFTAPAREGTYVFKAQVMGTQVESDLKTLKVVAQTLLSDEYLYILIVAAALVGMIPALLGRRRR